MTITPDHDTEFEPSGRRRKITKFALAGVAVLGVGAALTSAAWTDNVWFGGSTTSGNADLQGSVDGGSTWQEGSSRGARITMPSIDDVAPGVSVSETVMVRNVGTTDLALALSTEALGQMFADPDGAGPLQAATVAATVAPADETLESGSDAVVTVTVTAPSNWPQNFQDRAGTVIVNVQGTIGD
jgi:predicted ribosomally synthesized peptide with SipW-like signal peptide